MNFEEKLMIPLSDDEKTEHNNAKVCFLCKEEFCIDKKRQDYKNYCKVRDHCHFAGTYCAAAHNICNLKYKVPKYVPVLRIIII